MLGPSISQVETGSPTGGRPTDLRPKVRLRDVPGLFMNFMNKKQQEFNQQRDMRARLQASMLERLLTPQQTLQQGPDMAPPGQGVAAPPAPAPTPAPPPMAPLQWENMYGVNR